MVFQLHIWGSVDDKLDSFDPDCQAAVWYMGLVALEKTEVVASSNTWIDSSEQLPALNHGDKTVGGFWNIVKYMKSIGYDLDKNMSGEEFGECVAKVSYINTNVAVLSLYTLYLHRQNYTEVTRPLFSTLLPFPMQYNAAMNQQAIAKRRCNAAGFEDLDAKEAQEQPPPNVSRIQQELEAKREAQKQMVDDAKENIKAMNFAQDVYKTLSGSLDLPSINTADVLLLAHLQVQMSDAFPAPIMKSLLETQFPQLLEYYHRHIQHMTGLQISKRQPQGRELPSLTNAVIQSIGL